jgi:hypothetical protein
MKAASQTYVIFFPRRCVPRVPNMINYIFSMHLQLSNGMESDCPYIKKQRPYVSGFPIWLLWSQHTMCNYNRSNLMEGNPQLWSQQLSIMISQQVVLIVISQLYRSSIDQLHELWMRLWINILWYLSFSPENMRSKSSWHWLHIFKALASLYNEKQLSFHDETKHISVAFH